MTKDVLEPDHPLNEGQEMMGAPGIEPSRTVTD